VTSTELNRLMTFYETGRKEGSFDRGIERALRTVPDQPQVHLPRRAGRDGGRRHGARDQ
jgi:hypothetical protein